jgi:two-component sensor histidine kinase
MNKCFITLSFMLSVSLTASAQNMDAILKTDLTLKQKADTIFFIARKVFRKGKFDSADYWLSRGYAFAEKMGDAETKARYNIEWANSQYMQGQFTRGLPYIYTALPLLNQTNSYELHNSALLVAGNCYAGLQKTDSALKYFFECVEYNNKNFPYRNWLPYTTIGEVFLQTDNFLESEKYYQKAYELTIAKDGKPDHGYVLTMVANLYYVWAKPDKFAKMIEEYNQLLVVRKMGEGKDPSHNLMMIQWQTEKLEERVAFIKKVKEASVQSGALLRTMLANGYLINLYEKNKQYAEALKYAVENETLSIETKNIYNEYISNKIKYGLYKKMNTPTEVEKTADRLFILKDSMANIQRRDIAMDLESKYESDKKEKEIALLNSQKALDKNTLDLLYAKNTLGAKEIALLSADKRLTTLNLFREAEMRTALERENRLQDSVLQSEQAFSTSIKREKEKEKELNAALERENTLKEKELSKEKKLRWSLMGGATVLLLSGISIFALYKKQKSKNGIIQKQAADLEILMKEIHHRVKNNMQIVSSLLDLQSISIKDQHASDAVKEGKNRVQSMALIHQNLYSEDNLKGIKAKQYINNLLKNLCDSYNISNDKIKIHSNIEDLHLDVDTMIPIGLIFNELLTNAFKYAFNDKTNGVLEIALKEENNQLQLSVKDNGPGFPMELDAKTTKSFGLRMIRAFAQKLKAVVEIKNDDGAFVQLYIKKYLLA